ncbi:hypothetical protein C5167_000325 [Papaver somniferum]|uniref:Uncharacterized protein n=1 Tax=Papaver somniferum TaxID=3469 RepID=A0A4Y7KRJ9_PAPSO|nr:hypothetical protein C5167_000325 [Papaver somniferum]
MNSYYSIKFKTAWTKPKLTRTKAYLRRSWNDPLGQCHVTPFGFSVMMKKLMDLAEGLACLKTLLNDKPAQQSQETNASESSWRVIKEPLSNSDPKRDTSNWW